MKKILFFLCLSASCQALLPPAWEGVREIKAILDDNNLSRYLESGDVISKIEKNETGWIIQTNHAIIDVEIKRIHQTTPGPEVFEIEFRRN